MSKEILGVKFSDRAKKVSTYEELKNIVDEVNKEVKEKNIEWDEVAPVIKQAINLVYQVDNLEDFVNNSAELLKGKYLVKVRLETLVEEDKKASVKNHNWFVEHILEGN